MAIPKPEEMGEKGIVTEKSVTPDDWMDGDIKDNQSFGLGDWENDVIGKKRKVTVNNRF